MVNFTNARPLRIGTDCSGIETPIVAFQQLGIPFSHEFSSEIDEHCIATIRANFNPKIIFGDMRQRKLKEIPDIDFYVCGFPCQPFSMAGKRLGERDPRGTIFWECIRVIRYKKPMVFILENVPGLVSIDHGETFQAMLKALRSLRMYNVEWKILNTADYGIPQSRRRVFIVGIQKKTMRNKWEWPTPIPCRPLSEFVDWKDIIDNMTSLYASEKQMLLKIAPNSLFVDLSFRSHHFPNSDRICPAIITRQKLWCVPLKRFANVCEYLSLQGFPKNFKYDDTKTIKKQIGNAMSVNVLKHLFKNIVETVQ